MRRLILCIAALSATFTACGLAAQAKTLPELVAEAVDGYPWGSRGSFGENGLLREPDSKVTCSTAVGNFAGMPARITYVNYREVLAGVLVEPVAIGEEGLLLEENYPRLSIKDAYRAYEDLVASLGNYFGPAEDDDRGAEARHASWPCERVSATVSPIQVERCKRLKAWLDLRVLDQGKADMRLWIEMARNVTGGRGWSIDAVRDAWTRTPPDTWSEHGAFDVVWGMGIADVRDVYKSRVDSRLEQWELETYGRGIDLFAPAMAGMRVMEFIPPLKCNINFEFFRGRLCSISVSPEGLLSPPEGNMSDKERKIRIEVWSRDIIESIVAKYGPASKEGGGRCLYEWNMTHANISICRYYGESVILAYGDPSVSEALKLAKAEERVRSKGREEKRKVEKLKRF